MVVPGESEFCVGYVASDVYGVVVNDDCGTNSRIAIRVVHQ